MSRSRYMGTRPRNLAPLRERLDWHSIPEPNSGCLLWLGRVEDDGYGRIKVDGVVCLVHRVAWAEENGPIPDGLWVLHKCDVRCCINTDHHFLGTRADNMSDMTRKGRQARGEGNGIAKLTTDLVRAIRADPRPQCQIAADYGVSRPHISYLKARKSWSHI